MKVPSQAPGQALATGLAGLTAYQAGHDARVLEIGREDPAGSFAGACAIAGRLAEEVDRLGGDSASLLHGVALKAYGVPS